MYCVYGNSSRYIDCCPLYGRCPLLGVSIIGGSTVYAHFHCCVYVWCCLSGNWERNKKNGRGVRKTVTGTVEEQVK